MKNFKWNAKNIGLLIMAASVLIPALLWGALLIVTATPGGCSECSLGWNAVISVFLAIPTFLLGSAIAFIGAVKNAEKSAEKSTNKK